MAGSQGNGNGNSNGFNPRVWFNILYALARGHATCFIVFFRRNFGSEAIGGPGLAAVIIMLVVASVGGIQEMWPFFGLWVLAALYHRASAMRATGQGVIRHSRYEGDVDTKWIKNRAAVKQILEPLACVVFAFLFSSLGLSDGFVVFFAFGAFSLFLVATLDQQFEYKRLQAMRDAAIEQSYLASRYRGEIDER